MKRFLLLTVASMMLLELSAQQIKHPKAYDKAHFEEFQRILDNPTTKKNTKYVFTEAHELGLLGKMFYDTPNPYARIDVTKYPGMTKSENYQARCSAGLTVMFKTNSSTISVTTEFGQRYSSVATMPMAYLGYDLYIKNAKGEWQYASSKAAKEKDIKKNLVIIKNMAPGEKECLLYLPIYTEILSCKIGVEEGAYLEKLESPFRHKIVFHGSSYTHGISTSRAGMSYPMQFMRHTGLQVLGFGMSGNCKMQPYFADVLADVEADAYIFDPFSNGNYKSIRARLVPFIDRLVAAHPGKPLIFQQTIHREGRYFCMTNDAAEQAKKDMASTIFANEILGKPQYKDVYFILTDATDGDSHEYSVDGTHPDDHGYCMWARSIEKTVLKILAKYGIK